MPGREEALERSRLQVIRQGLGVPEPGSDPVSSGMRRIGVMATPRTREPGLPPDEKQRANEAVNSAFAGMAGLLGSAGSAASALLPRSDWTQEDADPLQRSLRRAAFSDRLPDLDPGFFADGRYTGVPSDDSALSKEVAYWTKSGSGDVDWNAVGRSLGGPPRAPRSALEVPSFGADLGSFSRTAGDGTGDTRRAFTVVPNVNSGRFSQRLAPKLIEEVYSRDAVRDPAKPDYFDFDRVTGDEPLSRLHDRVKEVRPVPERAIGSMPAADRVALMMKTVPGQMSGGSQSGYLWGTETSHPRYQYAGDGRTNNPEVLVSDINARPDIEVTYPFTGNTKSPYLTGSLRREVPTAAWGATAPPPDGSVLAGRRKRDTAGDIAWRGDLTQRRGGFSLADAQAIQARMGLPISLQGSEVPAGTVLEEAVESIRRAEDLPDHASVIEKYARRLPRLGNTTAPRQPAVVREGAFPLDTALGISPRMQRTYDAQSAETRAGFESRQQADQAIREQAARRRNQVSRVKAGLPLGGALLNLADPQAAGIVGAAVREQDPGVRAGLIRDAARVYGVNAATGAAQGAAISAGMQLLPRIGMAAAVAPIATGLAVTAPALTGAAVVGSVDEYLRQSTGEGLKPRVQSVQRKLQPALRDPVNAVFPAPRAVPANTPSGVAQLTRTRPAPSNPLQRVQAEVKRRQALAREARRRPWDLGLSEWLLGR